jgi:hypothetical protein
MVHLEPIKNIGMNNSRNRFYLEKRLCDTYLEMDKYAKLCVLGEIDLNNDKVAYNIRRWSNAIKGAFADLDKV